MANFADVEAFIEASRGVTSAKALHDLVSAITCQLGFDYFALIHHVDLTALSRRLTHVDNGDLVALTNYPADWVRAYVAQNIVVNDPIHLASHRVNVGFKWDDVPKMIKITAAHREIVAQTIRAGIGKGYTVPANVPGEANGSFSFAMRCGRSLPERSLAFAQLVGSFAFQAARTLVASRREQPEFIGGGLTDRQLECVMYVGRGKTDWEIGHILGISPETVKQHMKEAREHYDVTKRVQVVLRAVYEGRLPLTSVLH